MSLDPACVFEQVICSSLHVWHVENGQAATAGGFGQRELVRDLVADERHDPVLDVREQDLDRPLAAPDRVSALIDRLDDHPPGSDPPAKLLGSAWTLRLVPRTGFIPQRGHLGRPASLLHVAPNIFKAVIEAWY